MAAILLFHMRCHRGTCSRSSSAAAPLPAPVAATAGAADTADAADATGAVAVAAGGPVGGAAARVYFVGSS